MEQENLVKLITQEVLRQLNHSKEEAKTLPNSSPKVLALFTGGTIGLKPGLASLRELREYPADISVVLSPAAEKVVGEERVRQVLGEALSIITIRDSFPGDILRAADVVVVPVLTQNTAAKLVHSFSDTLVTTLVLQALMLGKPVIMAANAADPRDAGRAGAGMDRAPTGLARALQENLRKIEGYGVRLVDVSSLAEESKKFLGRETSAQSAPLAKTAKVLIDAAAVKAAKLSGERRLNVPRQAIVTPLAVDAARELGVELARE